MKQTVPLGRVAGISVRAHWSALIMVVLFGWVLGVQVLPAVVPHASAAAYTAAAVLGALAFIATLLAHELAHSLTARHYGISVESVTLWALGGVSQLAEEPKTARSDFRIAAAGPATSLGLGILLGGLAEAVVAANGPALAAAVLGWLATMNLLLGVFNLLPGTPLDGGRVLRAMLWRRYGDRARAARSAAGAGRGLGTVLSVAGVAEILLWRNAGGLWLILVGMFIASAASTEGRIEATSAALDGCRVRDVMRPDPEIGAVWMSVGDFVEHVARRSDQIVFPVVDADLSPVGVVGLPALRRLPLGRWPRTTVGQVAVRLPTGYLAAPDDPAAPLLRHPPLAGDLLAVVLDGPRIVGIVTATRLEGIVQRRQLLAPARPYAASGRATSSSPRSINQRTDSSTAASGS
ncbi:MAG TPA: site-2 protease family protein [Actinospica sp.]|nr:site-2 protease family protein [Actinospica sp.]